jgi:hypothetical protein
LRLAASKAARTAASFINSAGVCAIATPAARAALKQRFLKNRITCYSMGFLATAVWALEILWTVAPLVTGHDRGVDFPKGEMRR